MAARRAGPSRSPLRTLTRASVRCQGRSLFRPLGSPRGRGGPLSYYEEDNFIKRLRVAATLIQLSGADCRPPQFPEATTAPMSLPLIIAQASAGVVGLDGLSFVCCIVPRSARQRSKGNAAPDRGRQAIDGFRSVNGPAPRHPPLGAPDVAGPLRRKIAPQVDRSPCGVQPAGTRSRRPGVDKGDPQVAAARRQDRSRTTSRRKTAGRAGGSACGSTFRPRETTL